MHLRSRKALKEMARPNTNGTFATSTQSNTQSTQAFAPIVGANVSTVMGVTPPMLVSTDMGVTAPATVSTTAALTQSELVAYVPPLLTFHVTLNHQVRTLLDNRFFFLMQNFTMPMVTREQQYGMLTSILTGIQTDASTYAWLKCSPINNRFFKFLKTTNG